MTMHPWGGALALALLVALPGSAQAAVVLTGAGVHSTDFDTLASSGPGVEVGRMDAGSGQDDGGLGRAGERDEQGKRERAAPGVHGPG